MSGYKRWTHDPNAILDYTWNWEDWLFEGETIVEASFISDGGLDVDSLGHDDTSASARISVTSIDGPSQRLVTCRIVTSTGQRDDRTAAFILRNR